MPQRRSRSGLTPALLVTLLAVGCGGAPTGAFRPTYPDNERASLDLVLSRLQGLTSRQDPPVVVSLTAEGALSAYRLQGSSVAWTETVREPHTAPLLAGDLVVLHEASEVVARRIEDGRVALREPDDRLSLVGADGEGSLAAFVLSTTGGGSGSASRLVILQGGGVAHRIEVDASLGVPAVRGGMVFVPWGSQNVSVIDASSGVEIARLRSLAGVVSHALATERGVVFGQAGVGRLSSGATADAESVGWVAPPVADLPGSPPPWRSAYEPPAPPNSAAHKIRLVWAPTDGEGEVTFTDGQLYLTYYRLVFALSAADLSVRWAHVLPADMAAAAAHEGGLLIVDARGGVHHLAADGRTVTVGELAAPQVASVRLSGWTAPGGGEAPPPVADGLLAAAQMSDARLVPGRAFAVRSLAAQPGGAVTGHLLALCDTASAPRELRDTACAAIAGRTEGREELLAGLARQASFLEGTTAPPVGPLASLAARLGERSAAPLLIAHLEDEDTPVEAVAPLAAALATLADPASAASLREFLQLYAVEADEVLAAGLVEVARALVALDPAGGREGVRQVVEAPFTAGTTRGLLAQYLAEADAAAQAAEAPPPPE